MKKILLFGILALFVNIANAETDLLNLGSYNEGDNPNYGENVVIEQDETTSTKWVTGAENASSDLKRLKYSTNLSGDFELFVKADAPSNYGSGIEFFLIANDEYKIKLIINDSTGYLYAGEKRAGSDESRAWTNKINQVKLKVINNVAKLYVNDVFSQKITLKPDLTYTQMLVNIIKNNNSQIYELTTSSTASSNVPSTGESQTCNTIPVETTTTSGDCTADYTNGQLHVPCVAVSDPFGGKTIYDIKMNQQSSGFTFDLDMNSVKPR